MSIDLFKLRALIVDHHISSEDNEYHISLKPDADEIGFLSVLDEANAIEEFSNSNGVVFSSTIKVGEKLKVRLVQFRLERLGFYNSFKRFIGANSMKAPEQFYIKDLDYLNGRDEQTDDIKAYFTALSLSNCLTSLALFKNQDDGLMLYLMQEKTATSLKVSNTLESIQGLTSAAMEVKGFCDGFIENSERKMIYQKELIDFLNSFDLEQRYDELCAKFAAFHQRCESAYGFFLSDFSYGKLKLELESAVLDYSKNIRSIINDSQNKLIAIPAAFLVASSQLDFTKPFCMKNCMIAMASVVFSVLIEIFIKNQESAVTIFLDNVKNYKTTFSIKNKSIDKRINDSLNGVINKSFTAIDKELKNQEVRLNLIRWVNWGMSVLLIMVMVMVICKTFLNFG